MEESCFVGFCNLLCLLFDWKRKSLINQFTAVVFASWNKISRRYIKGIYAKWTAYSTQQGNSSGYNSTLRNRTFAPVSSRSQRNANSNKMMKCMVFLVLISLAVGFPLSDENSNDATSRWSLISFSIAFIAWYWKCHSQAFLYEAREGELVLQLCYLFHHNLVTHALMLSSWL